MSYREVMELPMRAFWLMNSAISRLQAEKDIRALTVANGAQSDEGAKEVRTNLNVEMGEVVRQAPIRDQEGINALKEMLR